MSEPSSTQGRYGARGYVDSMGHIDPTAWIAPLPRRHRRRHDRRPVSDSAGHVSIATPPIVATSQLRLCTDHRVHSALWKVVELPTLDATRAAQRGLRRDHRDRVGRPDGRQGPASASVSVPRA